VVLGLEQATLVSGLLLTKHKYSRETVCSAQCVEEATSQPMWDFSYDQIEYYLDMTKEFTPVKFQMKMESHKLCMWVYFDMAAEVSF